MPCDVIMHKSIASCRVYHQTSTVCPALTNQGGFHLHVVTLNLWRRLDAIIDRVFIITYSQTRTEQNLCWPSLLQPPWPRHPSVKYWAMGELSSLLRGYLYGFSLGMGSLKKNCDPPDSPGWLENRLVIYLILKNIFNLIKIPRFILSHDTRGCRVVCKLTINFFLFVPRFMIKSWTIFG
jgi:hypothetical protein